MTNLLLSDQVTGRRFILRCSKWFIPYSVNPYGVSLILGLHKAHCWNYLMIPFLLIRPFFQTRGYGYGFIFQWAKFSRFLRHGRIPFRWSSCNGRPPFSLPWLHRDAHLNLRLSDVRRRSCPLHRMNFVSSRHALAKRISRRIWGRRSLLNVSPALTLRCAR